MGRSEPVKKQSKIAKISKLDKKNLKKNTPKGQNKVSQHRKEKETEIEQIDQNENYVLPSHFEIIEDDLLLFEKLNALKTQPTSLEKNLKNHHEEFRKNNPASEPEVMEVYTK